MPCAGAANSGTEGWEEEHKATTISPATSISRPERAVVAFQVGSSLIVRHNQGSGLPACRRATKRKAPTAGRGL
jgi:hypothetical protein